MSTGASGILGGIGGVRAGPTIMAGGLTAAEEAHGSVSIVDALDDFRDESPNSIMVEAAGETEMDAPGDMRDDPDTETITDPPAKRVGLLSIGGLSLPPLGGVHGGFPTLTFL